MRTRLRARKWLRPLSLMVSLLLAVMAPLNGSWALGGASAAAQAGGGPVGLLSTAAPCLAINSSVAASPAGTVQLTWNGTAQGGRVVLDVAGTTAAQPVWVNGQRVGSVPAGAQGTPCGLGQAVYLDIPAATLRQGANQIQIGDSGQPGNAWTAANARVEVLGPVQPAPSSLHVPTIGAAAVSQIVAFTNHYDGSSQQAAVQTPDGYTGASPVPLVIYAHSRYGDMEEGINELGAAANARGWLLASPQLHGHWPIPPNPPGAFAYASLESQYDILGTLQYLLSQGGYNVDTSRIYLVGYSMGGQIATVTSAKYPDVFAALFDDKGPTNFGDWYYQQIALPNHSQQTTAMKQECYTGTSANPTPQPPPGNWFCYHRRSADELEPNLLHVPMSMTHSYDDLEVPITHSITLRDDVNNLGPDQPLVLYTDTTVGPTCPPYYHCYVPDPNAVLSYFQPYTLQAAPTHINIVSDESKSYYWLNIAQSGGDHWSYVETTASLVAHTVTLVVTDKNSLSLGLNLGTSPIQDWAGLSHPGLGLAAGTYHVQGAGLNTNMSYSSGYLTLPLPVTNQAVITIAPTNLTVHNLFLPAILK